MTGALGWIVALGGGASAAGYIALLIWAPQAAVAIERIALDLLQRVLSTRLGCAALAAVIVGTGAWFCGDRAGAVRVQAEWDAAEHAAIAEGQEARAAAEREIAPVPAEPAPTDPAPTTFHVPHVFNLRPPHACPPVPQCPAAPPRAVAPELRNDAHNRDHR